MQVLLLGGTQFIGRHITEALLAAGHRVSVFNRGLSSDPLPAAVERLRGDRDAGVAGLAALAGRRWDVCIDVSGYTPTHLHASTTVLRDGVAHYVFTSAVMVYDDPDDIGTGPVLETQPRVPPAPDDLVEVAGDAYGRLKVRCEDIVQAAFPGRCTVLRPQTVVGPHDTSGRYAYWLQRVERGGTVLAPGDGSDHLQVIDVLDLARFVERAADQQVFGTFNLAGPRFTWASFMALLGAQNLVWVPAPLLLAAGLGFQQLPLYRPAGGRHASLMHVSSERAQAAGLVLSDPAETLQTVRAAGPLAALETALSAAQEADLIAQAR